ncbi:uncharacterized protein LOC133871663 [Alnus glutinosa]|uniref:uncharacterized protein LOC133871663 n=1 Tax=Alnus glutinosa TaxID=3517 RepID=UPI002D769B36|nr:uncharacterized protein LOC133871663 [Alnus glutinosa]
MSTTSVSKINGIDHAIPHYGFELADYETIASRCNDITYLTDVIGRLESVGVIEEIKAKGRPTKVRKIQLLLEENKYLQTTLWGSTALQVDEDFYEKNTSPTIVIVTSTIVKTFRGEYNLSSTTATRVYINLKIPEVARVLDKLNNVTVSEVKELKIDRPPMIPDEELALRNRKTVAEIKKMEWKPETKEILITCLCKVNRIDNKFEWYYIGCLTCKTKVKLIGGSFWCERCKAEPKFSVPTYRIQIEVSDTIDSTTFIVFDKEGEQLTGKTAKELADMQDENLKDNVLPREMKAIVSNEYIFQLRLNDYNLKRGLENYTVSKIFEPHVSQEVQIQKETPANSEQNTEDEQTFTQHSSMSFSLPIEDVESDDDDMPIKLLCKRKRYT